MIGIYKIENTTNGKVYIGESFNIKNRLQQHLDELESNNHYNKKLQHDWNVYGKENFKASVIYDIDKELPDRPKDKASTECFLIYMEDKYIDKYNAINSGYNIEKTMKAILNGEKDLNVMKNWRGTVHYIRLLIKTNGKAFAEKNTINGRNRQISHKNKGVNVKFKSKIDEILLKIDKIEIPQYIKLTSFCLDLDLSKQFMYSKVKKVLNCKDIKCYSECTYLEHGFKVDFSDEYEIPYPAIYLSKDSKKLIIDIIKNNDFSKVVCKKCRDKIKEKIH